MSADPERSIGAYLARQRELRGISVEELAALTRIPRRSLERLESGVFDRAPDGFVRGFVRTVAAALGLDPDETVMRLLSEPAAEAAGTRGDVAAWVSPTVRFAALAFAGMLAAAGVAWLATNLRARPAARTSIRPDDEIVLRTDPIRDLAREAANRPPPVAEPPAQAVQAAPALPGGAPAEPAAPAEVAGEAADEGEEAPAVQVPGEPPAAVAPAAPDPAASP